MNLTSRPIFTKGQKPQKSPALRQAVRAEPCDLALPCCRHDPAYTVGAHLRLFAMSGTAQKPDDMHIVAACDRCHDVLDHRDQWDAAGLTYEIILGALMAAQIRRRAAGLIVLQT